MPFYPFRGGFLEVIVGPMFSGKSEELIRRTTRAFIAKQHVQVFKPALDTRYDDLHGGVAVASHNGRTLDAHAVSGVKELRAGLEPGVQVVAIDEGQFLTQSLVTSPPTSPSRACASSSPDSTSTFAVNRSALFPSFWLELSRSRNLPPSACAAALRRPVPNG